jgi:peptidylprolyl isomerase
MKAKTGDRVRVSYKGTLDDGTVFADSGSEPLEFTLGKGEAPRQIENTIVGMEPGEVKTVVIPSDDAFGPRREELILDIPKYRVDRGVEIGEILWVGESDDEPLPVLVVNVSPTTLTIDGNHPLAGKNLTFKLELRDIRTV